MGQNAAALALKVAAVFAEAMAEARLLGTYPLDGEPAIWQACFLSTMVLDFGPGNSGFRALARGATT